MIKYYYLNEWLKMSSDRESVKNQYISLLSQLTTVEDMSVEKFEESIQKICEIGDIVVCVKEGSNCETSIQRIVGSGTIIYEPKIIHGGRCVGHIEDIVVDKKHRIKFCKEMTEKNSIAKEIIRRLVECAKTRDCYKVILDCSEELEKYYERHGFVKKGVQMAYYY